MKRIKIITFILGVLFLCPASLAAKKAQVIPDVSIKSGQSAGKIKSGGAETTTFTRNDITDSPSNDISELLSQQQSVVHLSSSSGDTSQTALSIRGFGDNASANSLILVDGFPLTNPSLLAPDFNSIPLTDIKNINIFQGSQGTLWGNQAVGGVVNIITRHPSRFFANSIISGGSFHRGYLNVLVGDKASNGLFLKGFGLAAKTENFRDHNEVNGDNFAALGGLDYARGTFSINLQRYQNTTNFPGGLSQQQLEKDPQQATSTSNFSHYRTELIQLLSIHEFAADWQLETRASQYATDGNGKVLIDFTRRDSTLTFSPRVKGTFSGNKLVFGYDGQVNSFRLVNIKTNSRTAASQNDLYAQLTIPVYARLEFIFGTRAAMQSNKIEAILDQPFHTSNKVWVSEQGLKFHPRNDLEFYLRRDGNFRFPKANEQTSAASAATVLRAQQGASYETGMQWRKQDYLFQLNLYQLDLSKEIAFNPEKTASHPFGIWSNLDNTKRQGISIAQIYRPNNVYAINGQINYVNARFAAGANSGNRIPAVPAWTANAGVDYNWNDFWQAKYFLTYTGTRYASEDVQNAGARLASYLLNNAALQYTYHIVMLNFEILNLFNENYVNYAFYHPASGGNVYYPAPGRNYMLTLKMNLD